VLPLVKVQVCKHLLSVIVVLNVKVAAKGHVARNVCPWHVSGGIARCGVHVAPAGARGEGGTNARLHVRPRARACPCPRSRALPRGRDEDGRGEGCSRRSEVRRHVVLRALGLALPAHVRRNIAPVAHAVRINALQQRQLILSSPVALKEREGGEVVHDAVLVQLRVPHFRRAHAADEALGAQVNAARALGTLEVRAHDLLRKGGEGEVGGAG